MNKKVYDHILRVPYLNEGFTRIVKSMVKKSEINARIVVTPGKSIKSAIKPHTSKFCTFNNCPLCINNMPCKTTHYVYKFTCNICTKNEPTKKPPTYIGASRRKMIKRLGAHEASVRRFNDSTSLGEHMIKTHSDLKPHTIPRRGKVDFKNLFNHFTPQVIKQGKDTLSTYIEEGLAIRAYKPDMNTMNTNGFV